MPLYNYTCQAHGDFECWRPMAESAEPASCPACGLSVPRAVSAPSLANMDSTRRKGHAINERSADEPRFESRTRDNEGTGGQHHCGHGHHHGGHEHPHSHPHGHGSKRPWMIGH
jgi:putative FmdB family regulatory protein